MIKQSKTTIKEMSARYRSVLRHAFMAAAGLVVSVGAANALELSDVVNSTKMETAPMPEVSDFTYYWDKDGDGFVETELTVDESNSVTTTLTDTDYQYTSHAGTWDSATGPAGTATNAATGSPSSDSYTYTAAGKDYHGTDTIIDATQYSYTNTAANGSTSTVNLAAGDVGATSLATTNYDYAVTTAYRVDGEASVNIGTGASNAPQYSDYQFTNEGGAQTYNLGTYVDSETGNLILPSDLLADPVLAANASSALQAFTNDRNAYNTVKDNYTTSNNAYVSAVGQVAADQTILTAMHNAYQSDVSAQSTADGKRSMASASLTSATGAWNTAVSNANTYDASMARAVDDRISAVVGDTVDNVGNVKGAAVGLSTNEYGVSKNLVDNGDAAAQFTQIARIIGDRTTMNGDNINGEASIADNLKSLNEGVEKNADTLGTIHGLISTESSANRQTTNGKAYKGNLAIGTTVEDHLLALDDAIGDRDTLDGDHVTVGADVTTNLQSLNDGIEAEITRATGAEANLQTAIDNIGATSTAAIGALDNRVGANTNAIIGLDKKVHDLDKDLSAGIAGVAALSSVEVSNVKRGELSVGGGYGYYNGQSAMAVGAAMGLTDNWSINAGAGFSNADTAFRAGTNYKFKLF